MTTSIIEILYFPRASIHCLNVSVCTGYLWVRIIDFLRVCPAICIENFSLWLCKCGLGDEIYFLSVCVCRWIPEMSKEFKSRAAMREDNKGEREKDYYQRALDMSLLLSHHCCHQGNCNRVAQFIVLFNMKFKVVCVWLKFLKMIPLQWVSQRFFEGFWRRRIMINTKVLKYLLS